MPFSLKQITNFWKHVDKSGDCWLWTGWCFGNKYGCFRDKQKKLLAHRVSYELHFEPPAKRNVLHRCDNPRCVNPAHLFAGSQQDNVNDMILKNRKPKGERCTFSKLKKIEVLFIKKNHKIITQKKLSEMFGISKAAIQKIHDGDSWKDL